MPRTIGTTGSGITERAVVAFDGNAPGDIDALTQAGTNALDRMSFERLCRRLAKTSTDILGSEGLPYDAKRRYMIGEESSDHDEAAGGADPSAAGPYSLADLVLVLGHAPDSSAMYAASILMMIERAFALFREGDVDQALAAVFALGELVTEAGMKDVWEADAIRGDKVLRAARQGHAMEHGDAAEIARRRQAQVTSFERHRKAGLGKMAAYQAAAEDHDVDPRTIQRAVKALQA